MAMEIYILRHGKAEQRSVMISSDAGRRLTESGIEEMRKIASGITALGLRPCHIVSSPLERAKTTARIVAARMQVRSGAARYKITIWPELKPESDILEAHRRLADMAPDASIMLVGHEPHLSSLALSMIQTGSGMCSMDLKKGGLAIIRGNASGRRIQGSLRSLMTPKQLRMCRHAYNDDDEE